MDKFKIIDMYDKGYSLNYIAAQLVDYSKRMYERGSHYKIREAETIVQETIAEHLVKNKREAQNVQ